jgi:hypothetical protein
MILQAKPFGIKDARTFCMSADPHRNRTRTPTVTRRGRRPARRCKSLALAAISPEVATDSDPVEVFGRRAELSGTLDGFREGNGSAYGSRSPGWGCGIGCRRQGGQPERNRPPASGRARDRQRVLSGEIAVPGDRGRQNIVGAVIGWRISPSICSNLTGHDFAPLSGVRPPGGRPGPRGRASLERFVRRYPSVVATSCDRVRGASVPCRSGCRQVWQLPHRTCLRGRPGG